MYTFYGMMSVGMVFIPKAIATGNVERVVDVKDVQRQKQEHSNEKK